VTRVHHLIEHVTGTLDLCKSFAVELGHNCWHRGSWLGSCDCGARNAFECLVMEREYEMACLVPIAFTEACVNTIDVHQLINPWRILSFVRPTEFKATAPERVAVEHLIVREPILALVTPVNSTMPMSWSACGSRTLGLVPSNSGSWMLR
jgi:hypothetical protein